MTDRGRVDKRRAILAAALRVFALRGYAQTCVQDIATEAGVAKPTIYNHLLDKESLFREAIAAAVTQAVTGELAAIERLREPAAQPGDLGPLLEEAGHQLLRCQTADESWALRRLVSAESRQFPDLLDVQQDGADRVREALAGRLARLVLAGRLHAADPELAAEQFLALLTGPLELRTRLGTRRLADDELRSLAQAAAGTFLRAYSRPPVT